MATSRNPWPILSALANHCHTAYHFTRWCSCVSTLAPYILLYIYIYIYILGLFDYSVKVSLLYKSYCDATNTVIGFLNLKSLRGVSVRWVLCHTHACMCFICLNYVVSGFYFIIIFYHMHFTWSEANIYVLDHVFDLLYCVSRHIKLMYRVSPHIKLLFRVSRHFKLMYYVSHHIKLMYCV